MNKPKGIKLPNAPLTEVVFELHWKLAGAEGTPDQIKYDPGYRYMSDEFRNQVGRLGFPHSTRHAADNAFLSGYGIEWRFHKNEPGGFPLLQIGPGIFAANDAVGYVWGDYKDLCLAGLKLLLKSRPKMNFFDFEPNLLELRFTDSFSVDQVSGQDLAKFANANTSLKLTLPSFCDTEKLGAPEAGQVGFAFPVKGAKGTQFSFAISNALVKDVKSIVLLTRVTTKQDDGGIPKSFEKLVSHVDRWLEDAHAITSPFFKDFVSQDLMKAFER